ncbi:MAG: sugar phosphate nucleotidyltransferase [Bacteroidota bacterium]|nr:sugar phosphate nucleotidyltransferase [Bacteroidota bacterium]
MAMKGMILAAGYGTRLAAVHADLPKPLVPAGGKPMITWALEALRDAGCSQVVVNLHHRARQLASWLEARDLGLDLTLIYEKDILGTGGGILNAAEQLRGDEPFLVCNADTYTAQDLGHVVEFHRARDGIATLMVNERETRRAVLLDAQHHFLGKESWFSPASPPPGGALRRGFCGVHVISPVIFEQNEGRGFADIFDVYRRSMQAGASLYGFTSSARWADLGTPERIRAFEQRAAAPGS